MNKDVPILFHEVSECCACGACLNVCPVKAISMKEDEYGFLFPQIDEKICIKCQRCKKACAFQTQTVENTPVMTYAAKNKDQNALKRSASGGIFYAIAKRVVENGGVVAGAEMQKDRSVRHVVVDNVKDLERLQGSKYVQSNTGRIFEQVQALLASGKQVFFSGTPCQVAGLYGFLGEKTDNLLTAEIVCHGVPSRKMLQDYLASLSKKHGGEVEAFSFRDKSLGWGINGSAMIQGRKRNIWQSESPYLYYFSKGWLYRDSCYSCKYASKNRIADLTLGDYWGIEKQHPDYLGTGNWNERDGISVVIANTERGMGWLRKTEDIIEQRPSSYEKAAEGNGQLRCPSKPGKKAEIMEGYKDGGWAYIEDRFNRESGWKRYSSRIKARIPLRLKRLLKRGTKRK